MQNPHALLFALLSCFLPLTAEAGAWLQESGDGQIISSYSYQTASYEFNSAGIETKSTQFSKSEISTYFEYGASDEVTIGGASNFQRMGSGGANLSGPGFLDLFIRTEIAKFKGIIFSIEPSVRLPLDNAAQTNPEGNNLIPALRVNVGTNFIMFDYENFVSAALGYRLRTEDRLKDIASFEATIGSHLRGDTDMLFQLFYDHSFGGYKTSRGNYDLLKTQISALYNLNDAYALQAGAFSNLSGKNTRAGNGIIVGVWYKF